MINHVRTLLLNLDGPPGFDPAYPGEEFVSPDYRAVPLPPALASVRQGLFGTAPDRAFINYRLRQLMTCLHATDLHGYATDPDPRLTYWPARDTTLLAALARGPAVFQTSGPNQPLYVGGQPPTGYGKLYYAWRVVIPDSSNITITPLAPAAAILATTYPSANGLGGPVALPGSLLRVTFATGQPAAYTVTYLAPPAQSLPDVAAALAPLVQGPAADALFGPAEPYLTFGNLWASNRQLPYRLGGLVLALAYRTDALRS